MRFRPIQTHYNGYRFRSRKEARWAHCFDALGIRWDYEPEGYEFGNGDTYLPDFLLPDLCLWVEVKGEPPDLDEFRKATALALCDSDNAVVITWENFEEDTSLDNIAFWLDDDGVFHTRRGWRWLDCPEEGWAAARSARFEHGETPHPPRWRDIELMQGYGELPY